MNFPCSGMKNHGHTCNIFCIHTCSMISKLQVYHIVLAKEERVCLVRCICFWEAYTHVVAKCIDAINRGGFDLWLKLFLEYTVSIWNHFACSCFGLCACLSVVCVGVCPCEWVKYLWLVYMCVHVVYGEQLIGWLPRISSCELLQPLAAWWEKPIDERFMSMSCYKNLTSLKWAHV